MRHQPKGKRLGPDDAANRLADILAKHFSELGPAEAAAARQAFHESVSIKNVSIARKSEEPTFYEHFRSKEDLLSSGTERLDAHLLQEWESASDAGTRPVERLGSTLLPYSTRRQPPAVLQGDRWPGEWMIIESKMRRFLADLVLEDLKSRKSAG